MKTKLVVILAIVLSVTAIAMAGVALGKADGQTTSVLNAGSQINAKEFQAVFLTNGQAYFGRLAFLPDGEYKLTNVYYLKDSNDMGSITKLGDEEHKPEDKMVIPARQVQFWENLQNTNQFNGALK